MKNLLILIVAVAIFLHFYPQPELEEFYQENKAKVLEAFSDATDTKVRLSASRVFRDIEAEFEQFNGEEQKFIKQMTESRDSIKAFFAKHCEKDKQPTPKLHQRNQKLACEVISKYQSLF